MHIKNTHKLAVLKSASVHAKMHALFLPYFTPAPKVTFTFQTLDFGTTLWNSWLSKPADYAGCAIYKFETYV